MQFQVQPLIAVVPPQTHTLRVPVLKIFDGDGFSTKISPMPGIEIDATVRFGFIDAPEIGQTGGVEARNFLVSLIGGKSVDIAVLTKMDTGKNIDRYKRIVCIPYLTEDVPNRQQGRSAFWANLLGKSESLTRHIELEMVLNGWAWVMERYEPDEQYFDALSDARLNKRGIWAERWNQNPWEFKKQKYQRRDGLKVTPEKPKIRSVEPQIALCPTNGCCGRLTEKVGKFGKFLGCTNFPRCKYTRNQ